MKLIRLFMLSVFVFIMACVSLPGPESVEIYTHVLETPKFGILHINFPMKAKSIVQLGTLSQHYINMNYVVVKYTSVEGVVNLAASIEKPEWYGVHIIMPDDTRFSFLYYDRKTPTEVTRALMNKYLKVIVQGGDPDENGNPRPNIEKRPRDTGPATDRSHVPIHFGTSVAI